MAPEGAIHDLLSKQSIPAIRDSDREITWVAVRPATGNLGRCA
jgi:hypothetical protein